MPNKSLARVTALIGAEAMERLRALSVLVVGVGAVGGACVESLARSGIGRLQLVDGDVFDETNLNRQPFAARSVLGQSKVAVTCARLADIAPACVAMGEPTFVKPEGVADLLDRLRPDCVVDCCDDLPAKVALLAAALERGLPAWSAMGAARKLDPAALRVTDISKTQVCPLARNLRRELRQRGITRGIRCVWSTEAARPMADGALGSYMPVTAAAGHFLAADIIAAALH